MLNLFNMYYMDIIIYEMHIAYFNEDVNYG